MNFTQEFLNFSSPKDIFRNQQINVSAIVTPVCNHSFTLTYAWKIFKIDILQNDTEIQVPFNPTFNLLDLKIPKDTLFYGTYKFRLQANLTVNTGYIKNINNIFSTESEAYVRVLPTEIDILTLENSLNYIKIGYDQTLRFQPAVYSFDYDNLANFKLLKYKYFCFLRNKSENLANLTVKNFDLTHDIYNFSMNFIQTSECFPNSSNNNEYFLHEKKIYFYFVIKAFLS